MRKAMIFIASVLGLILFAAAGIYFIVGMDRFWTMTSGNADLGPVNFQTFRKTDKPNQYLICPEGYCGEKPDRLSPVFNVSSERLYAVFRELMAGKPNITPVAENLDAFSARYVARSELLRFPDTINIQFIEVEPGKSAVAVYGRSQIGHSDLGVNKARIDGWIEELENAI